MKAFPSGHDPKTGTMQHGMELRDYFAARASDHDIEKYLLTDEFVKSVVENSDGTKSYSEQRVKRTRAEARYLFADEMMKARDA